MSTPLDPTLDWLADAPLTAEQRLAWDQLRTGYLSMQSRMKELEKKLLVKDSFPPEEQNTLLTRPEFNREVARMLAFDERYGGISSILYFDFDNLGQIEERFGKPALDAVLQNISGLMMRNIRTSDILGRLAVNEFGVLLVRCDNGQAWRKGEQLAALLHDALQNVQDGVMKIEVSYGAYTFRENEDVAAGLKEAAQVVTKGRNG